MRFKVRVAMLAILIPVLGGCASVLNTGDTEEFACPGMPKGILCKNPRDIYGMTNGDVSDKFSAADKSDKRDKNTSKQRAVPLGLAYQQTGQNSLQPEPIVSQARVLRVWIAPWIDKNKDLHWPGLMFTRIQQSEWNFGESEFNGVEPVVPHQIRPIDLPQPKSTGVEQETQQTGGMSEPQLPSEVKLN